MISSKNTATKTYKSLGNTLKKPNVKKHICSKIIRKLIKWRSQVYNLLLRKNGYATEDYAFLLFYVPKEITETGEVIFDTNLVKMKIDVKNAEKNFKKAIKVLNEDCPKESCEWCKLVKVIDY